MRVEILTALEYEVYSLLVMLFSLPEIYPEDGHSRVLKIIDIYSPKYSDFFFIVLQVTQLSNNCDALARRELPV
jgi:hypothetical protein